ncbi:O-antigen ligase [Thioalkalivibrio sp. ALJ24]|uniref:O-antigen ligase family protein n=1 Tax=Thioalkalivibrio sp. ALJ24 TaxID=545276 RepID=UPI001E60C610|nr:O-antigen ligase family protein [Thioalkalivibrio sp. ALJ24]
METTAEPGSEGKKGLGPLRHWAIGSAYGFAFFGSISISLGQLFQAIMLVLAIIIVIRHWSSLRSSPMLWVTVGFILYVIGRGTAAALLERPDMAAEQWEGTGDWVRTGPLPILLMGLMLAASGNWIRHSLGIVVTWALGFLLMLASGFSLSELHAAIFEGHRYMEGVNPWIDGLKLATLVLAALALAPALLGQTRGWGLAWRITLWTCATTMALVGIVVFQARTIWLATLIGLLFLVPAMLWFGRRELSGKHSRTIGVTILLGVITAAGVLASSWDNIQDRWAAGDQGEFLRGMITTPPSNWIEELPSDGQAIRAAYLVTGFEYLMERPMMGYGPADPRYLRFEDPDLPDVLEGRQGHFHNGHLEIMLRFGGIGYAFIVMTILLSINEIRIQVRRKNAARFLALATAAFLITFLVASLASANLNRFRVEHLYGIMFGVMWAAAFARKLGWDSIRPTAPPIQSNEPS